MTRRNLQMFAMILVGLIVGMLASGCASQPPPVIFNHATYHYTERQGETNIFTSDAGGKLIIEPVGEGTRVTVDGQAYLVEGTASDVKVTLPDGRQLEGSYTSDTMAGLAPYGTSISTEEWNYLDELRAIVFSEAIKPTRQGGIVPILTGLLLVGAGLLALINPSLAWQVSEGWRYKNVEPSDPYLGLSRVGGVVMIIVGLAVILSSGG